MARRPFLISLSCTAAHAVSNAGYRRCPLDTTAAAGSCLVAGTLHSFTAAGSRQKQSCELPFGMLPSAHKF